MDGVANDGILNLVNNMFDFEELKVQTSGQSAEFSRSVGLTMTGKSGGNDFHGRFYYDLLNSALNARDTFEAQKTPFKQHRYGLNVNGPIIKNKTFFYFGYSAIRIPSGSFFRINVRARRRFGAGTSRRSATRSSIPRRVCNSPTTKCRRHVSAVCRRPFKTSSSRFRTGATPVHGPTTSSLFTRIHRTS